MILFRCPLCTGLLGVPVSVAGAVVLCPKCQRHVSVPAANPVSVPQAAPSPPPSAPPPLPTPVWMTAPPPVRHPAANVPAPQDAFSATRRPDALVTTPFVEPIEEIQEVLPVAEWEPQADYVANHRHHRRVRRSSLSDCFPEPPVPPFLTFDRVIGLILMGSGLLFLVLVAAAGGTVGAGVLVGGFFLILGAARFFLTEFMTGLRTAGLISLLLGLLFAVSINLAERKGTDTELGLIPVMFGYVGAFLCSILGLLGLLKD